MILLCDQKVGNVRNDGPELIKAIVKSEGTLI
jgi:hypothetical protein